MTIEDRADTDERKAEVARRILAAWQRSGYLRLGPFILCSVDGSDLFELEDDALARRCEEFASKARVFAAAAVAKLEEVPEEAGPSPPSRHEREGT